MLDGKVDLDVSDSNDNLVGSASFSSELGGGGAFGADIVLKSLTEFNASAALKVCSS